MIIWAEGSGGTPSAVIAYEDGVTNQIRTTFNPRGFIASGNYVAWGDGGFSGESRQLALAKLITDVVSTEIDLGSEHGQTNVSVNGETTVIASQFSNWNWSPTYIEFGVEAVDGLPLDGLVFVDSAGNEIPMNGNWDRAPVSFTGQPVSLTITSESNRELRVQWWVTTEPNPVHLGGEYSTTHVTIDKPTTLEVNQFSNWWWGPTRIGFGIGSDDGQELNGVRVVNGNDQQWLGGWWNYVERPFYWQPVKIVVEADGTRSIRVEWWAAG